MGAISLVLPLREASTPVSVVVATTRGEAAIPVALHRGHAALALPPLSQVLPVTAAVKDGWADVGFAGRSFRFLLDGGAVVHDGRVLPLAGGAYVERDTLFLPLQWLAEIVPTVFHEGYRYDPLAARLEEVALTPVITRVSKGPTRPVSAAAAKYGLRTTHTVVIDAGHGGRAPGTIGLHFPRGVQEKHITLLIATQLRAELEKRGITARMTRTSDTLIALDDRGASCRAGCDLFLSIHVNSMPLTSRSLERTSGIETYYLAEARTAEAAQLALKENEDVKLEGPRSGADPLARIFSDLQSNEYLRESALLADLIHQHGRSVHPGGGGRGVAQAQFVVLTTARRPAVLIETGYATNREDAKFLMSPTGRGKLTRAIADGVVAFLQSYERKLDTTVGDAGR